MKKSRVFSIATLLALPNFHLPISAADVGMIVVSLEKDSGGEQLHLVHRDDVESQRFPASAMKIKTIAKLSSGEIVVVVKNGDGPTWGLFDLATKLIEAWQQDVVAAAVGDDEDLQTYIGMPTLNGGWSMKAVVVGDRQVSDVAILNNNLILLADNGDLFKYEVGDDDHLQLLEAGQTGKATSIARPYTASDGKDYYVIFNNSKGQIVYRVKTAEDENIEFVLIQEVRDDTAEVFAIADDTATIKTHDGFENVPASKYLSAPLA